MRKSIAGWILGMAMATACGFAPGHEQHTAEPKKEAQVHKDNWAELTDSAKAAHAKAVLRVKWLSSKGGDKFTWDEVEVLHVIKNESSFEFPKKLYVAHYSWEPGIPKGDSTIYLEPYNDTDESQWKLVDGSAKSGVSHPD